MANVESNASYYALLNVSKEASDEDIRRAFRSLAQTYHPDKHAGSELQSEASASFTLLQEAYEVLSDPHKRQIYDIYGKEGLASGLEVSTTVNNVDELKKKWAKFKAQQAEQAEESNVAYRGLYVFRFNAENLIKPYDTMVSRKPDLSMVSLSQEMHVALSSKTTAVAAGRVTVQRNLGEYNGMLGLRHAFSHLHHVEATANLGLQTLLSASSSYQLTRYSAASLAVTYQPQAGMGMQLSTSRQLTPRSKGEFTWVLGPGPAQGMVIGVNTRFKRVQTTVSVEVGASTTLNGRVAYKLDKRTTLHASARANPLDGSCQVEVGERYRWGRLTTTGLAVACGTQGLILRGSVAHGDQRFEIPILLTKDPDIRTVLLAYLAPPLLCYSLNRFVVRPLWRRHRLGKALEAGREAAAAQQQGYQRAQGANHLMGPVAARKLRQELTNSGLVIVRASYGTPAAIEAADAESRQQRHSGQQQDQQQQQRRRSDLEDTEHFEQEQHPQQQPSSDASGEFGEDEDHDQDEGIDEEEAQVQQAAEAILSGEGPPACLDVTLALRYMVNNSQITFHPGVSKSGQMGFCDCAPNEAKILRVLFLFKTEPRMTTLLDMEGGTLPNKAMVIEDQQIAQDMLAELEQQRSELERAT